MTYRIPSGYCTLYVFHTKGLMCDTCGDLQELWVASELTRMMSSWAQQDIQSQPRHSPFEYIRPDRYMLAYQLYL